MNQHTSFQSKNNEENDLEIKEKLYLFINGLGAFLAIALANIALLFLPLIVSSNIQKNILIPVLVFLILYLLVYSTLTTRTRKQRLLYILKRFFDVLVIAPSFFIISPLLILVGIAIKIESPGPIIYHSKRIGQFGKLIDTYTFRTKYINTEKDTFTKIGRFLYRSTFYQMLFLYNILEGGLSIVGPRPRRVKEKNDSFDPETKILLVPPGIFSLYLVSNIPKYDPQKEIELDLEYINNWSLILDFKILIKSMLTELLRK